MKKRQAYAKLAVRVLENVLMMAAFMGGICAFGGFMHFIFTVMGVA